MISVFGLKVGREELAEVQDCIERQWLGAGPKTKAFEEEFSARLHLPNLVVVNSGSYALYVATTLLDLPPGSDVIVPSFTWVSCAHSVLLAGHRPVFCDVDLATQNPTVETISAAMTPRERRVRRVRKVRSARPVPPVHRDPPA